MDPRDNHERRQSQTQVEIHAARRAQSLGSGAAALVAAEQLDSVDISGSANSADVVVVGAGFAGMGAARTLMRQGKKVAVLVSV